MDLRLKTRSLLIVLLAALSTSGCDAAVDEATDWAIRRAEQAQQETVVTMETPAAIALPDDLTVPLIGDYTVLSVNRDEVGDHTFLSVSVLYIDAEFADLAQHFDSVFAAATDMTRTETSSDETMSVSWAALDPIRSVAMTGAPGQGIVAVGISEDVPKR